MKPSLRVGVSVLGPWICQCRKRQHFRMCQIVLLTVLSVAIVANVVMLATFSKTLQGYVPHIEEQTDEGAVFNRRLHFSTVRGASRRAETKKGWKIATLRSRARASVVYLEVMSSQDRVAVVVNETLIYNRRLGASSRDRGIHVLILNQHSAEVMSTRVFDTYAPGGAGALEAHLSGVSDGRLLVAAILDEGTFHLDTRTRRSLATSLRSKLVNDLAWRDVWTLVATKRADGGTLHCEKMNKSRGMDEWAAPLKMSCRVRLQSKTAGKLCPEWPGEEAETARRREFCSRFEGYGSLCRCSRPSPIAPPAPRGSLLPPATSLGIVDSLANVPVSVVASNRPHYLLRMLRSLLRAADVHVNMITVYVDGYFPEPAAVAKLMGVKVVQNLPMDELSKTAKISQNYKTMLAATFDTHPSATHAIVLEEDVEISPDFFQYFSQVKDVLTGDPTLYCSSAWNDHGYEGRSADPRLVYRVEGMPGLGWMLTRSLFQGELRGAWPPPENNWDWDMWLRSAQVRKGRECLIPDVSRTFHFGEQGVNMNGHFHRLYFARHAFHNSTGPVRLRDVDKLTAAQYDDLLRSLLAAATPLDHSLDPCSLEDGVLPPATKNQTYVLYIAMETPKDFSSWLPLAKCLNIWDLDVRGVHKSLWRMFVDTNHLLVVGVPASPFSSFKPANITPKTLGARQKLTPKTTGHRGNTTVKPT